MKKLNSPIDKLGIIRFLHLHCFIHIYRVFFTKDASKLLLLNKVISFQLLDFNFLNPLKTFISEKSQSTVYFSTSCFHSKMRSS